MPLYRPVRLTETSIPDRLADISRDVDAMSALTSGQINSTITRLRETIRALPITVTVHGRQNGFDVTSVEQDILVTTYAVPKDKTHASVFAGLAGFYNAAGARSAHAGFTIRIASMKSQFLPKSAGNMDTYQLGGVFSANVDVTPGGSIEIAAVAGAGKTLGSGATNWATIDAVVTFNP